MAPLFSEACVEPAHQQQQTVVLVPSVKRPAPVLILDDEELGAAEWELESAFDLEGDIASSVEGIRLNLVSW
jgi:hypothetical protein